MNRFEEAMANVTEPTAVQTTRWKPEVNDTLGGRVRYIGQRETQFGDQMTLEIITDDGELIARAINGALHSELESNHVEEGDVVAVKFLGQKIGATSGRSYNTYAVRRIEAGPGHQKKAEERSTGGGSDEFKDDMPF